MNPAEKSNTSPQNNSAPPIITAPPVLAPLPKAADKPQSWRKAGAVLLSLLLGFFVASGFASIADDTCVLLWGTQFITALSGILTFISMLLAILLYILLGLIPAIPKRVVLPVVGFMMLSLLATLPVTIYCYQRVLQFDWIASWCMVALGLGMIRWLQGTWRFRWPLVSEKHLGTGAFSWRHFAVFLALNLFVALPAVAVCVAGCASLAVTHFTEGFVALRPSGIYMQARKYARNDGKTILLMPMSHIAESDFYQAVTRTVSSNSVVLLEGVTDSQNLLTNKLTYQRAAKSLHLADQHADFNLNQGELVRADVDVKEFSTNTIGLLNLVALVHSQGLNSHTLSLLLECSPSPDLQQQLFSDILLKRNAHLLEVLKARLPGASDFIIPWGAAHMPGISHEIEKSGFHLVETHEYESIRFWR